jgi:hypothetical protein
LLLTAAGLGLLLPIGAIVLFGRRVRLKPPRVVGETATSPP